MDLKELRAKKGLTQKEAADAVGISPRAWQYYETGEREMKVSVAEKIADYFLVEKKKPIDRISELIDYLDIPIARFESESGLSNNSINMAIKRRTNVQAETLNKIIESFPMVNAEWLYSGKGDMINSRPPAITDHEGVPYYDVDFMGGFDLVFNQHKVEPSFYIDYAPYNNTDAWINVVGKSMSPFISHGDLVAIKKLETWREFIPYGEIYAIVTEEFRTIKIVTASEDPEMLKLIPYNKSTEFVSQDIPKKLINQMYAVKGSIKKFF